MMIGNIKNVVYLLIKGFYEKNFDIFLIVRNMIIIIGGFIFGVVCLIYFLSKLGEWSLLLILIFFLYVNLLLGYEFYNL